jgi:predicted nuclease with TOPRIM domain
MLEILTPFHSDQAPAAIQERLQQLEAENKNLAITLNKLQEEQQQKKSTQTHLENQNRSLTQQLDDLQAKFHLLETELSQTRRKVIKQEIPLPVGVIAQPRLPTTSTTTTTTTTAPNGSTGEPSNPVKTEQEDDKKQNGASSHELADALAIAEARLEEASKLREEKVALLRENTRLRDELAHLSVDRVTASEPYPFDFF